MPGPGSVSGQRSARDVQWRPLLTGTSRNAPSKDGIVAGEGRSGVWKAVSCLRRTRIARGIAREAEVRQLSANLRGQSHAREWCLSIGFSRGEEVAEVETADARPKALIIHVSRDFKRSTRPDPQGFSHDSSSASACRFTTSRGSWWQHSICCLHCHLAGHNSRVAEAGQPAVGLYVQQGFEACVVPATFDMPSPP